MAEPYGSFEKKPSVRRAPVVGVVAKHVLLTLSSRQISTHLEVMDWRRTDTLRRRNKE